MNSNFPSFPSCGGCVYMCAFLKLGLSTRGLGVCGFCWIGSSHSSSLGVKAPKAPITSGTTLDFTFSSYSSCSSNPWYFLIFSCSFFLISLLAGIATSITAFSCWAWLLWRLRRLVCVATTWNLTIYLFIFQVIFYLVMSDSSPGFLEAFLDKNALWHFTNLSQGKMPIFA